MINQVDINPHDLLNKVIEVIGDEKSVFVSIICWEDGDYFKELCEEDGGTIDTHLKFFNELPFSKKLDMEELNKLIDQIHKLPFLTSKNGNYKLNYDFHLWSKSNYLIYNAHLGKFILKERSFIDKLLSRGIRPPWQS